MSPVLDETQETQTIRRQSVHETSEAESILNDPRSYFNRVLSRKDASLVKIAIVRECRKHFKKKYDTICEEERELETKFFDALQEESELDQEYHQEVYNFFVNKTYEK